MVSVVVVRDKMGDLRTIRISALKEGENQSDSQKCEAPFRSELERVYRVLNQVSPASSRTSSATV